MKEIEANIKWLNEKVFLTEKKVFLFCFGSKCMSGKIKYIKEFKSGTEYSIGVEFIDAEYFKSELYVNNQFTINEASKVIANGEVKKIC